LLEERFLHISRERAQQLIGELERTEKDLKEGARESHELELGERPEELLLRTRSAGKSFARAFADTFRGGSFDSTRAMTLEEEFAARRLEPGGSVHVRASVSPPADAPLAEVD